MAVVGAIVIGLVGLSGNPPPPSVTSAPVTMAPTTPAPASTAVEEVGFDWSGTADLKEVSSSDGYLKAVGATWTEYWTFITDCVLQQSCGAALNVVMNDDVTQFNATLSRHGLTYTGKAAIDNYWTCPADNQPLDGVLYITLTGKSTGSSTGPEITSFTGVLKWDVSAGGKCPNDSEYDMQVHST